MNTPLRLLALGLGAALGLSACAGAPPPAPAVLAANGASPTLMAANGPPKNVPIPEQKMTDAQAEQNARFTAFLRDFRTQALSAGISGGTYDRATANIHPNARIITLNESQPEFVRPVWDYLSGAVSELRVKQGRTALAANAGLFTDIEKKEGTPREIVAAIWGIETNFGENTGGFNLFEALATLAYDGPRQDYGRREMLAALKLAEAEHIDPAQMTGSWAGAVGQTQFVPSSYLAHGVDGDGDGKRDLWRSNADALTSTAAYLKDSGWKEGQGWGEEVTLPQGFAFETADPETKKSVAEWNRLGVRTITGSELSNGDAQGAIFLPAGARGPAFLVRDNFGVILKYNFASSYALAVGLLSDRLRGADGVTGTWPRDEVPLNTDQAKSLQDGLTALGFNTGGVDGVMGRMTRAAVRNFQKSKGIAADGFATRGLLDRVNAERATKGV